MIKNIKAWIELDFNKKKSEYPTIWLKKPSKREVRNANDFKYKFYEAEIKIGREIKK